MALGKHCEFCESNLKKLIRQLKRRRLEYNEALEDHGDESREFLWAKATCEALECAISFLDQDALDAVDNEETK